MTTGILLMNIAIGAVVTILVAGMMVICPNCDRLPWRRERSDEQPAQAYQESAFDRQAA